MSSVHANAHREPLAIIAGVRTPFAKSFTALADVPADELGRVALLGAVEKAGLTTHDVDEVIFGNVSGPAESANVSRVLAIKAGVPHASLAHTVNRNCASGMESIISAWQAIGDGRSETIVAGGTESMSNVPLLYNEQAKSWFMKMRRAKGWQAAQQMLAWRPSFFSPVVALELGLTDPTCKLNMGETGEILAKEFGISRADQDDFALESHRKASAAWERCFMRDEVVPISSAGNSVNPIAKDVGPRANQSIEALAKLKPLFDRENGTITAGNSCPITDGAAALVVTSLARARKLGVKPLGYLRGYAIAGLDPRRMGLGPAFAIAKLLDSSGLTLKDFDLFEINEAFAAQVLACLDAMRSESFARNDLHRGAPVGELPIEKLNVNGGAIALGHPVGTSGTRLVLTLLRALREKGLHRGLASLCVGGGQGYAMWLETELQGDVSL
jgi:acetyl-CoA C-acetyltransferase/acetyl-CoA acyltransferase